MRYRNVTPELQQVARAMREEMTPAEQALWQALRDKRLEGLKFRAQHPVGQFVLDFYCPRCKLVVELDGDSHRGREDQDEARIAYLSAYGDRVLRFRNDKVLNDLSAVLDQIRAAALPSCPPSIGG